MRIKSKLIKVEQRLGVADCPHCGRPVLPRSGSDEMGCFTDEERHQAICNIFQRFCTHEQILHLLTECAPALRVEIADVYPLSSVEQEVVDLTMGEQATEPTDWSATR